MLTTIARVLWLLLCASVSLAIAMWCVYSLARG